MQSLFCKSLICFWKVKPLIILTSILKATSSITKKRIVSILKNFLRDVNSLKTLLLWWANWIQPSKFLANETTSYLDEKAGSEVLSKVVETRWQSWNPKAGFWFEMNELERFIFYDYKMISATNGGFWVVWMASFNESHELLSIEDIAVHGVYDTGGYYENENGYGIKSSAYHSNTMLRFESREIISNTYNYVEYFHEFNDIIKEDYSSKERPHSIIIH